MKTTEIRNKLINEINYPKTKVCLRSSIIFLILKMKFKKLMSSILEQKSAITEAREQIKNARLFGQMDKQTKKLMNS